MKTAELLTWWKPKKQKKVKAPSGFWLVGLAGPGLPSSGEGGEGGGLGEDVKEYRIEDLPLRFHIDRTFYAEREHEDPIIPPVYYVVKRMMFEEPVAHVHLFPSTGNIPSAKWDFTLENNPGGDTDLQVSQSNLYNHLKLKWWIKNRLIEVKLLPPIGDKRAD